MAPLVSISLLLLCLLPSVSPSVYLLLIGLTKNHISFFFLRKMKTQSLVNQFGCQCFISDFFIYTIVIAYFYCLLSSFLSGFLFFGLICFVQLFVIWLTNYVNWSLTDVQVGCKVISKHGTQPSYMNSSSHY